jgi:hypothetical protein
MGTAFVKISGVHIALGSSGSPTRAGRPRHNRPAPIGARPPRPTLTCGELWGLASRPPLFSLVPIESARPRSLTPYRFCGAHFQLRCLCALCDGRSSCSLRCNPAMSAMSAMKSVSHLRCARFLRDPFGSWHLRVCDGCDGGMPRFGPICVTIGRHPRMGDADDTF